MNNTNEEEKQEISTYINSSMDRIKNNVEIDCTTLFIKSTKTNITLAFLMWFAGLTVIGIIALYGIVCFRGFILGYSISCIMGTLGLKKGMFFTLTMLLPQNIIFIPTIFALAISGIRLYKSIIKDRQKENIKIGIFKHTMFSAILGICLIVSSFIETYISTKIFMSTTNIL